jgi:Mn-dependent DtxR family transcriptional regulator
MLEEFLRMLGVQEETIQQDVEGIEHHVSPHTMEALQSLVLFFKDQEQCLQEYNLFCKQLAEIRSSDKKSKRE